MKRRGANVLGAFFLLAGAGTALPSCKKTPALATADAGPRAGDSARPSQGADAGGSPLVGPPTKATGPRPARALDVERFADLTTLKKDKNLGGAGRFIEEATRDVYASKGFAAEIEKTTGEALRHPSAIVLERMSVGAGPELWRVTYEAWCGKSTSGAAGYKSDHRLVARAGKDWRLVGSYRPGCEESGEPEVLLVDLDGDGRDDIAANYASTKLGAENHLDLRVLRRTTSGFESQPLLRESSPFQTLEVRYLPAAGGGGGRDLHFRTFREDSAGCNFFELTAVYTLDRQKGVFVRGKESLRPVPPKGLADEGEDVDSRCEK